MEKVKEKERKFGLKMKMNKIIFIPPSGKLFFIIFFFISMLIITRESHLALNMSLCDYNFNFIINIVI